MITSKNCLDFCKKYISKVLIWFKSITSKAYLNLTKISLRQICPLFIRSFKSLFKISNIKTFFSRENFSGFKTVHRYLSRIDQILILIFTSVIVISGFFIWQSHWLKITKAVPTSGGTLTEGIVGDSKDLEKNLSRLTNDSLVTLQSDGTFKGEMAVSWQMLDSNKTYEFKLHDGISSEDLAAQLRSTGKWSNIEVATPADNLIDFKFKQPFSPFLYISTEPVFSNGPYKIIKEDKIQETLAVNPGYYQTKPYISKIIFRFYPNEEAMIQAAKNHEIMNYLKSDPSEWQSADSSQSTLLLQRQLLLFFNLKNNDLKNLNLRQALRDNHSADKNYNFTLVTSNNPADVRVAEQIKAKWAPLKVNLTIKEYDNVTLKKTIIPQRSYDILLYTLDYGSDPDPYPFWHTSQIGPNGANLSNYSNKQADRLLEDARQSFDSKVRQSDYDQFNKILVGDVPFIKLSQASFFYVISNDVNNVGKIYGFSEADRFLNINQWYIKTKRVKK